LIEYIIKTKEHVKPKENHMSLTIKDISRIAGVSHGTVSKALNNTGRMKEETRQKILKIAEQLNYVPNFSAKSLVNDKSYTIGVFSIKEKILSSTFYEIIEGIQEISGLMYNLVFRKSENEYELDKMLKHRKYDGIIFISIINDDLKYIDLIASRKIPFVVINRRMHDSTCYNVVADDNNGAFKATEHLIKLGHTSIAYVEGPPENIVATERRTGYLDALKNYGIPVDDSYIVKSNGLPDGGFSAMHNLLTHDKRPTAVFVYSDPVAIGVIKAIWKEELRIPEDIAVIGFDNMVLGQYSIPSLTTIDKPRYEMGKSAAILLIKVLNNEECPNRLVKFETGLIIRESCGALISN
jgi:LacI family transcriptional regulator